MQIDVILPLAFNQSLSYAVPVEYHKDIKVGVRVEVALRKKYYSGIVKSIREDQHLEGLKNINTVLDEEPVVSEIQLKFWGWIAQYYVCTIGQVMAVALPTGLKLNSETTIEIHPEYQENKAQLSNKEYLMMESLHHQQEINLDKLRDILKQKSVHNFLKVSFEKRLIVLKEELREKYKPKLVDYIRFTESVGDGDFDEILKATKRSKKQTQAIMSLLEVSDEMKFIPKTLIYKMANVDASVISALQKKNIIEIYKKQESRLKKGTKEEPKKKGFPMSAAQLRAFNEIKETWKTKTTALIHGITGSGKTEIYKDLIAEALDKDDRAQILYLLPEIALTTQIIGRIEERFGNKVAYYHSRMNNHEQVELWNEVLRGKNIIVGARSSLFLPFQNLKLIIVDEEHDHSFKQQDPAPRYNARDTAIVLASLTGAKVLLGSATPSLESFLNGKNEKYGYVPLMERFGKATLPDIEIVDLLKEEEEINLEIPISKTLRQAINNCLEKNEQAIIFQNRRGYAPALRCFKCGWQAECNNCDVTLTIHQHFKELRCHYCGHRQNLKEQCPTCGHKDLKMIGYGTEKIEDIFKSEFPNASVARMDHDTVRSKLNYEKLLYRLENREIDILVGTQMITKGLDFDHITLVGILDAEKLFHFPDFRASERAFQLLTQVSGRAGRRSKKGRVIIQTSNAQKQTLQEVLDNNFEKFIGRELFERRSFLYPPFNRLLGITIKHQKREVAHDAAKLMIHHLQKFQGLKILGPAVPSIARVRNQYIYQIMLKYGKGYAHIKSLKEELINLTTVIKKQKGASAVRVNIDVDPY